MHIHFKFKKLNVIKLNASSLYLTSIVVSYCWLDCSSGLLLVNLDDVVLQEKKGIKCQERS